MCFPGTVGECSVKKEEIKALCIGLKGRRLNFRRIQVEGDSAYTIRWAFGSCSPWAFVDAVEEVHDLSKDVEISFVHVKISENSTADSSAKDRVVHQSFLIV